MNSIWIVLSISLCFCAVRIDSQGIASATTQNPQSNFILLPLPPTAKFQQQPPPKWLQTLANAAAQQQSQSVLTYINQQALQNNFTKQTQIGNDFLKQKIGRGLH
ncbi:hypothetical protein PVAND_006453 [Polypedilum vanderplanki]|uniref:Uncharacterized protein n=1 Tax=Polypedilum vanderplanki TaxID=319348 RepID=A0A9J6C389_POLVA|nr:hypothetical protein PVAND_006453 [Polypedilum vanderplanki]